MAIYVWRYKPTGEIVEIARQFIKSDVPPVATIRNAWTKREDWERVLTPVYSNVTPKKAHRRSR